MINIDSEEISEVERFFSHWVDQFLGVPESVFHYTGSAGMHGIVADNAIRLTNIAYLNDSSEYIRSAERIHLALEAVTDLEDRPGVRFMFERLRARMRKLRLDDYLPPPLTFVASFSELRDDLSQWRGYGGPQASFALGFNAIRLSQVVSKAKGYLIRCIYDDQALNSFVRNLLEHIGGVFHTKPDGHEGSDEEYADALIDLYAHHLEWLVPVFKDPAFAAEKEVRIIVGTDVVCLKDLTFDPKPSVLSGYVKMALQENESGLMPLVSVDIGPSPNSSLSMYAARALLIQKGYSHEIVAQSRIPFRTL